MNTQVQKLEMIDWILHLNDISLFGELSRLKNISENKIKTKRKFGCGKGIFTYVAADFNKPLSDFKEYTK